MWDLILYCLAVVVGLILIWTYEPTQEGVSEDDILSTKKREGYKQPSIYALLGLDRNDFLIAPRAFEDHFETFQDVSRACKRAGLEALCLVIGVDFTASNEWQGRKTFNGNCLHRITGGKIVNPYQKVINILGQTLEPFRGSNTIQVYGFGDAVTKDKDVFPFCDEIQVLTRINDVLDMYNEVAKRVTLSGPTSFAPIIYKSLKKVKETGSYHVLILIADGQVTEEQPTVDAIVEASNYPLSIIVVGVGDGPWDLMEEFDSRLPKRKFDNFRFVDYHLVTSKAKNPDTAFALNALMEIPDQYKAVKMLGYLSAKTPV